jgi:hypothetical protein
MNQRRRSRERGRRGPLPQAEASEKQFLQKKMQQAMLDETVHEMLACYQCAPCRRQVHAAARQNCAPEDAASWSGFGAVNAQTATSEWLKTWGFPACAQNTRQHCSHALYYCRMQNCCFLRLQPPKDLAEASWGRARETEAAIAHHSENKES